MASGFLKDVPTHIYQKIYKGVYDSVMKQLEKSTIPIWQFYDYDDYTIDYNKTQSLRCWTITRVQYMWWFYNQDTFNYWEIKKYKKF